MVLPPDSHGCPGVEAVVAGTSAISPPFDTYNALSFNEVGHVGGVERRHLEGEGGDRTTATPCTPSRSVRTLPRSKLARNAGRAEDTGGSLPGDGGQNALKEAMPANGSKVDIGSHELLVLH